MSDENKKLVRTWFEEVWNKRDLSAIPRMYHKTGKAYGFPEPESVTHSPEEFAKHAKAFHDAFDQMRVDIDDMVAEGDKVAVRWTATMTHTGGSLGIPPTSKKVRVTGSSFVTCGKGQILDGWNYADFTRMRLQLEDKI
jgi:predicted ester cyclase